RESGADRAKPEGRHLSAAAGEARLDRQTGNEGETTFGYTDDSRPSGAIGTASGSGADLQAGFCGRQLWIPSESKRQGRIAACRRLAESGISLGSRCRLEELLRYDSTP